MAGMEELEVHSKSYLVRWVHVKGEHTISWSIQPHKKSLNFGIFKHPGTSTVLGSSYSTTDAHSTASNGDLSTVATAAVVEKLTGIGLKCIQWVGKCEADRVSRGTYDVPAHEGGNYALVFDNTFSKQTSKTATFVLLTYPTGVAPQSNHNNNNSSNSQAATPSGPPANKGETPDATETPKQKRQHRKSIARSDRHAQHAAPPPSGPDPSSAAFANNVHAGILHKRRRKRGQGWARRFFSLDLTSSTLSYYRTRTSPVLRGAMPLSLSAVSTNEKTREICIDSGAEIWHLRAHNQADFTSWKAALEKASSTQAAAAAMEDASQPGLHLQVPPQHSILTNLAEEREWAQVEHLVSKLSGTRDAVRQLAKDTDPKYFSGPSTLSLDRLRNHSPSPNLAPEDANGEEMVVETRERRPFWRRKSSANSPNSTKRSTPAPQLVVPSPSSTETVAGDGRPRSAVSHGDQPTDDVHDHLMALLRDLDSVVGQFSALIADSKQRRRSPGMTAQSRLSMESDVSQEFFDAPDGGSASPFLTIHEDSEDAEADAMQDAEEDIVDDDDASSSEEAETATLDGAPHDATSTLFPTKPKSLIPLPLDGVKRRTNISAPTVMPPSLIGFLRKNVGKDLSQISMPVSANEPLSLLQRAAEVLEYSDLLDEAARTSDPVERLLIVTAFALSPLSSGRVKERAIRKPFNPMLGETYELVREDRGFRFVAEKVSHRPVQLAYQAESKDWSFTQSPVPTQKFWGKSAEIITEGKLRLTLHTTGEHYSWSAATSFLRHIIAGEKYVEPVGEMCVVNETTGHRTISTFKPGGMFSGRSEELTVRSVDPNGRVLALGMAGTWTSALHLTGGGGSSSSERDKTIWTAGRLVDHAPKHYGLTTFAASLNEITPIEAGKIPVTDSRLRPDQRALEDGDLDRAEEVKVRLEEGQRARRKELETKGETWTPRWFVPASVHQQQGGGGDGDNGGGGGDGKGETVWRLKTSKDGYWEERARGSWTGVIPVFQV